MKNLILALIAVALFACTSANFQTPKVSFDGQNVCLSDTSTVAGNYVHFNSSEHVITIHTPNVDITATFDSVQTDSATIVIKGCYKVVN